MLTWQTERVLLVDWLLVLRPQFTPHSCSKKKKSFLKNFPNSVSQNTAGVETTFLRLSPLHCGGEGASSALAVCSGCLLIYPKARRSSNSSHAGGRGEEARQGGRRVPRVDRNAFGCGVDREATPLPRRPPPPPHLEQTLTCVQPRRRFTG